MIYLLIYIFISYGITTIVTQGDIFSSLRDWLYKKSNFIHSIFTCPLCFSTWLGFIMATILITFSIKTPIDLIVTTPIIINIFLTGCFTAGTTWFINGISK